MIKDSGIPVNKISQQQVQAWLSKDGQGKVSEEVVIAIFTVIRQAAETAETEAPGVVRKMKISDNVAVIRQSV